jgi:aryl-alcohol dehydrogenase-like predicted oxidoreductase
MSVSGKPTDVRRWCEESLKNLQVDSIDLYYQHRVSKIYLFHFIRTITDLVGQVDRTIPIEETWKEMKKLKEEGKVKYLGISEATVDEIRRAHAISPISALQVEVSPFLVNHILCLTLYTKFSPWTPDIKENGILDACRELGISIVAYSPLGRGFLTGAYKSPDDFEEDDWRRNNPRFTGEAFKEVCYFV